MSQFFHDNDDAKAIAVPRFFSENAELKMAGKRSMGLKKCYKASFITFSDTV